MGRPGPIWLVGMMGAGKSCVGRRLARALELPFADSDDEVEQRAGLPVAEIFAQQGEAAFRRLEDAVVASLTTANGVVALGGGAPAQPGVARRLAETGCAVYLRARPETLLARLGACDTRPLLAGLAPEERRERLARLLREREPAYQRAALVVDTDALDAGGCAREVEHRLRAAGRL